VRLLLSGAHGFLPHSQVGMRLGRAVRFIANGHFWWRQVFSKAI